MKRPHYIGNKAYHIGYTDGAEAQRKIDIDKACEWLKQKFRDKDGSIAPLWFVFLDEFREAMEE